MNSVREETSSSKLFQELMEYEMPDDIGPTTSLYSIPTPSSTTSQILGLFGEQESSSILHVPVESPSPRSSSSSSSRRHRKHRVVHSIGCQTEVEKRSTAQQIQDMCSRLEAIVQDQAAKIRMLEGKLEQSVTLGDLKLSLSDFCRKDQVVSHVQTVKKEISKVFKTKASHTALVQKLKEKVSKKQLERLMLRINRVIEVEGQSTPLERGTSISVATAEILKIGNPNQNNDPVVDESNQEYSGNGQSGDKKNTRKNSDTNQSDTNHSNGQNTVCPHCQTALNTGATTTTSITSTTSTTPIPNNQSVPSSPLSNDNTNNNITDRMSNLKGENEIGVVADDWGSTSPYKVKELYYRISKLEMAFQMLHLHKFRAPSLEKLTDRLTAVMEEKMAVFETDILALKASITQEHGQLHQLQEFAHRAEKDRGDASYKLEQTQHTLATLEHKLASLDTQTAYSKAVYDRILPQAEEAEAYVRKISSFLHDSHMDHHRTISGVQMNQVDAKKKLASLQVQVSELKEDLKNKTKRYATCYLRVLNRHRKLMGQVMEWQGALGKQLQSLDQMTRFHTKTISGMEKPLVAQVVQIDDMNQSFAAELDRFQEQYARLVTRYQRFADQVESKDRQALEEEEYGDSSGDDMMDFFQDNHDTRRKGGKTARLSSIQRLKNETRMLGTQAIINTQESAAENAVSQQTKWRRLSSGYSTRGKITSRASRLNNKTRGQDQAFRITSIAQQKAKDRYNAKVDQRNAMEQELQMLKERLALPTPPPPHIPTSAIAAQALRVAASSPQLSHQKSANFQVPGHFPARVVSYGPSLHQQSSSSTTTAPTPSSSHQGHFNNLRTTTQQRPNTGGQMYNGRFKNDAEARPRTAEYNLR